MKKLILLLLLIAFPANADHLLKWDASNGAIGYKIYFNEFNKDVGDVTQCNLNDLNIEPNVAYTYHVTAYNECGESEPSNTLDFTRPLFEAGSDNLPVYEIRTLNKVVITITQE